MPPEHRENRPPEMEYHQDEIDTLEPPKETMDLITALIDEGTDIATEAVGYRIEMIEKNNQKKHLLTEMLSKFKRAKSIEQGLLPGDAARVQSLRKEAWEAIYEARAINDRFEEIYNTICAPRIDRTIRGTENVELETGPDDFHNDASRLEQILKILRGEDQTDIWFMHPDDREEGKELTEMQRFTRARKLRKFMEEVDTITPATEEGAEAIRLVKTEIQKHMDSDPIAVTTDRLKNPELSPRAKAAMNSLKALGVMGLAGFALLNAFPMLQRWKDGEVAAGDAIPFAFGAGAIGLAGGFRKRPASIERNDSFMVQADIQGVEGSNFLDSMFGIWDDLKAEKASLTPDDEEDRKLFNRKNAYFTHKKHNVTPSLDDLTEWGLSEEQARTYMDRPEVFANLYDRYGNLSPEKRNELLEDVEQGMASIRVAMRTI